MSAERTDQILAASYEILGRDGLEGLHARAVAAEVNVNHATVHYYFPTRKDLLMAVIGYARQRFQHDRELARRSTTAEGAVEADLALFEAYTRPTSRFFRVWTSLFVAAQADADLRNALVEFTQDWRSGFEEALAGAEPGPGKPFRDPLLFLSAMLGTGLLAQLLGEEATPPSLFDRVFDGL